MQLRRWIAINLVLLTAFAQVTAAQSTDAGRKVFTLQEAVNFALKNYPAVRAAMERTSAAEAGIGLARTNYLPRADMLWQGNRASRNNILGLLLPCAGQVRLRPRQLCIGPGSVRTGAKLVVHEHSNRFRQDLATFYISLRCLNRPFRRQQCQISVHCADCYV